MTKSVKFTIHNLLVMEGILYLRDENNKKRFVQIDWDKYGSIMEDFIDGLAAQEAENDEYVSMEEFTSELKSKGLLNESVSSKG